MKKTIFLTLAFLFLTGLRAPDGEIILTGDSASKILRHLGRPLQRVVIGYAPLREVWTYQIEGLTYQFTIENGVLTNESWTR